MATVIERFYGELSKKLLGRSVGEGLGSTGKGMRSNREGGAGRTKEEQGGRRREEGGGEGGQREEHLFNVCCQQSVGMHMSNQNDLQVQGTPEINSPI